MAKTKSVAVQFTRPNLQVAVMRVVGQSPYCQNKFSAKARNMIADTQRAGSQSKKGKKREPKDFEAAFEGAKHRSEDGWCGIPAPAFRNAMISACRLVGFQMTKAKLSVFVLPDGFDADDGTPLVKIIGTEPVYREGDELPVRNESGVVDLRARPMWREWSADVMVQFDADMFSSEDIVNLMMRAGLQVGIGEGRPDSKKSTGIGWGTFTVEG